MIIIVTIIINTIVIVLGRDEAYQSAVFFFTMTSKLSSLVLFNLLHFRLATTLTLRPSSVIVTISLHLLAAGS